MFWCLFCFCSLETRWWEWEDKLQRADCAKLWDEALGVWVIKGTCVERSGRAVCCAGKMGCRGKVELMQQSLTSADPVGQLPGLLPTEAGVILGLAGGRG